MKPLYKILIIAGVIIIAAVVIYLAWQKIAGPAIPTPSEIGTSLPAAGETNTTTAPNNSSGGENGTQTPTSQSNSAATPVLTKISESQAFGLWVLAGTGEIYYLTPEGKVFKAEEGTDLEITTQPIAALNRVIPAPGGERALAAFGDPHAPQWAYFDAVDQSWHSLPGTVKNATWAGKSDQIVALIQNGNETNLSLISLSQTAPSTKILVSNLGIEDVNMWFQTPEQLIIAERSSGTYASRVWRYDLKTSSFNLMLTPQRGLLVAPADLGNAGAILQWSAADQLFLLNNNFERGGELDFSTFPEKCSAGDNILYCFVPREPFPESALLPDDYYRNKFYTTDSLIRTTITSTSTLAFGAPDSPWASTVVSPVDAKNPVYADGALYFINRYDNYVYKLTLGTTNG